jgi:hypothetical protein
MLLCEVIRSRKCIERRWRELRQTPRREMRESPRRTVIGRSGNWMDASAVERQESRHDAAARTVRVWVQRRYAAACHCGTGWVGGVAIGCCETHAMRQVSEAGVQRQGAAGDEEG